MYDVVKYNAMDVARYIVAYCAKKGNPITNLRLQKILYFAWIEYYKETKNYLFDEEIQAWKFGPVVPVVYRHFSIYAGNPITRYLESDIDVSCIDSTIEQYIDWPVGMLVDKSHRIGGAWRKAYEGSCLNKCVIPFETIIALEV